MTRPLAAATLLGLVVALGPAPQGQGRTPEATALGGAPLYPPTPIPDQARLEKDLQAARSAADPGSADAMIWVGRRLGYLWRYQEAIAQFTRGIERYPDDPRFYRHRGHRYITVRQFDRAVDDFTRAAALIKGRRDEIEPDGAPNPAGVPRSTLHFNIWYHLALAHYLQGHYEQAQAAWVECMKVSDNDDAVTATSDWMWMTLMRLGHKAEAAKVLERITPKMDILENASYHRRLLMYKGLETPAALLDTARADATTIATQGYGVGNYYYVTGEVAKAREIFRTVTSGAGWNAFGYIAAEADLHRLGAR